MSEHCKLKSETLASLHAMFLQFTGTAGVLRCLKPTDDTRDAQGLMFRCPKCKDTPNAHNVVLLFNLPSVPDKANPPGRWDPMEFPPHMKSISLIQEVVSNTEKCGFRGHVLGGYVNWR